MNTIRFSILQPTVSSRGVSPKVLRKVLKRLGNPPVHYLYEVEVEGIPLTLVSTLPFTGSAPDVFSTLLKDEDVAQILEEALDLQDTAYEPAEPPVVEVGGAVYQLISVHVVR